MRATTGPGRWWTAGIAAAAAVSSVLAPTASAAAAAPAGTTPRAASVRILIDCFTKDALLRPISTNPRQGYSRALVSYDATGLTPGATYKIVIEDGLLDDFSTAVFAADGAGGLHVVNAEVPTNQPHRTTYQAGQTHTVDLVPTKGEPDQPRLAAITTTVHGNPSCGSLRAGGYQSQVHSADGRYRLVQQNDGNLVLYSPTRAVWSSRTNGHPGAYAIIQPDGNVVVYTPARRALWSSRTNGHAGALVEVRDDGTAVVRNGPVVRWSTRKG